MDKGLKAQMQKAKAKWAPLIADLDKGMNISRTAKKHGQNYNSFYKYLRNNNLLDRYKLKHYGGYPPELRAKALQLFEQGKTVRAIAQELNVGKSSVHHWVNGRFIGRE